MVLHLFIHLSVYLPVYLSRNYKDLNIHPSIHLSAYLPKALRLPRDLCRPCESATPATKPVHGLAKALRLAPRTRSETVRERSDQASRSG